MKTENIIGRQINEVLFTEETIDGTTAEAIYFVLEDGTIYTAPDEDNQPLEISQKAEMLKHSVNSLCHGKKIIDVFSSNQLPFYSILLEGNSLLTCRSPTPFRFEWYVINLNEVLCDYYEFTSIKR